MADQTPTDYQSVAGFTPDLQSAASTSSGSYRPVQPPKKMRAVDAAPVLPVTPGAVTPTDLGTSTSSSSAAPPSPPPPHVSVSVGKPVRPSPVPGQRLSRKAERLALLERLAQLGEETEVTEVDRSPHRGAVVCSTILGGKGRGEGREA